MIYKKYRMSIWESMFLSVYIYTLLALYEI